MYLFVAFAILGYIVLGLMISTGERTGFTHWPPHDNNVPALCSRSF